jgi:hypothetical protein
MTSEPRTVFTIRIAAKPGQAGIHALRAAIKELLKRHHLVCIDAREEHDDGAGDVTITEEKSPSAEAHPF